MKRVLLDCDGVIADFVSSYLALLNKHGGTAYTHEDITDWDIVGSLGIPSDVAAKADAEVDYDFCRNLAPIAGAVEGTKALAKVCDLYIVTSPWVGCRGWTEARYEWLLQHCGIKAAKVMHGSAKHICGGDFLVDDKESTIVQWQAAYPSSTGIVWAQPWNRRTAHPFRTDDWDALLRLAR